MTTLREAAQQALEAMDDLHRTGDTQVFDLCHRETTEALRAALEQYDKDRVRIEEMKANWALQRKLAEETQERDKQRLEYEAALAEPPDSTKPVVERNFCPRCGKRTNDIHTCTPPLTEQGCDHCRHVLYAATKCKNCGRVTE